LAPPVWLVSKLKTRIWSWFEFIKTIF